MCAVRKPSGVRTHLGLYKTESTEVKNVVLVAFVKTMHSPPNSTAILRGSKLALHSLVLSKYRGNSDSLAQAADPALTYHPLQPFHKARTAPSSSHLGAPRLESGEYTASALDVRGEGAQVRMHTCLRGPPKLC